MAKVLTNIKNVPYRAEVNSPSGNLVVADEPIEMGGKNTGFSPKELLVAALGSCTSITLRMYIERKEWDIPEIKVETELIQVDGISTFSRKLIFTGEVSEEQKKRLISVANACPVHKILANEIEFDTKVVGV